MSETPDFFQNLGGCLVAAVAGRSVGRNQDVLGNSEPSERVTFATQNIRRGAGFLSTGFSMALGSIRRVFVSGIRSTDILWNATARNVIAPQASFWADWK